MGGMGGRAKRKSCGLTGGRLCLRRESQEQSGAMAGTWAGTLAARAESPCRQAARAVLMHTDAGGSMIAASTTYSRDSITATAPPIAPSRLYNVRETCPPFFARLNITGKGGILL